MRIQTIVTALVLCGCLVAGAADEPRNRRSGATPQQPLTAAMVDHASRVYKTAPQGQLALHFSLPRGWRPNDARPAIVFFFGGGWKTGSPRQFVPQCDYLASRGMIAAAAEYRTKSVHGTNPDACVEDAKSAVRWIRGHACELGVDPGRIVAAGGSAGGHLAACTALVAGFDAVGEDAAISARPNALVLFNPALHVDELAARPGSGIDAALAEAITPNRFVHGGTPPAIIFFGTDDPLRIGAERYVAKARPLGVRAELWTAAGQPHGFFNRSPWMEATARRMDLFLQSLGYLAGPPTIDPPPAAELLQTAVPAGSPDPDR